MNQKELQKKLFELQDKKYKEFHSLLCPGTSNIIGVRVPVLRQYAKELYNTQDWENILKIQPIYYEEIMLQGMLIGFLQKEKIEVVQEYIEKFIPKIDNWAICDTFVSGLKITKKHRKEMWDFIQKYLNSNKEFEIRYGIVMLLDYYIIDDYIDEIIKIIDNIKYEGYYVKMAIAWAVSVCYVKYPEKTYKYLKNDNLDDFTHNKAIQKIKESYRVTKVDKEKLQKLKR